MITKSVTIQLNYLHYFKIVLDRVFGEIFKNQLDPELRL